MNSHTCRNNIKERTQKNIHYNICCVPDVWGDVTQMNMDRRCPVPLSVPYMLLDTATYHRLPSTTDLPTHRDSVTTEYTAGDERVSI